MLEGILYFSLISVGVIFVLSLLFISFVSFVCVLVFLIDPIYWGFNKKHLDMWNFIMNLKVYP